MCEFVEFCRVWMAGHRSDHGGFALKQELVARLRAAGHELISLGASTFSEQDDYPDFVFPLAYGAGSGESGPWRGRLRKRRPSVRIRQPRLKWLPWNQDKANDQRATGSIVDQYHPHPLDGRGPAGRIRGTPARRWRSRPWSTRSGTASCASIHWTRSGPTAIDSCSPMAMRPCCCGRCCISPEPGR